MAFNGSGTFVRVHDWTTDLANTVPVTASRMDDEMDGMATGLSTALCKDGQQTATARIPFAAGVSSVGGSTSAASYAQIGDLNTGLYFPGSDQWGLVAGGTGTLVSSATVITAAVPLSLPDGSLSNPALTNTGDENTGIWFSSANTISLVTGGTERAQLDGQGFVYFYETVNVAADIDAPNNGSAIAFLGIGNTAAFGIYFGNDVPTVSAAKGSLYLRTDGTSTTTRIYVNTNGGTTWTHLVSGA